MMRQTLSHSPADHEAKNLKELGNEHFAKGDLDTAATCYRKAIDIAPGYAEAHNNLGLVFAQRHMFDEAAACFLRAIALDTSLAQPHTNLGNAHRSRGRLGEALACFRAALALDPDRADVYNNMGILLQELGQLDEAHASLRKAISLRPEYAEAHNNLGMVLRIEGRLDEAHACFRAAVELKPDLAIAHNNLGTVATDRGRLSEAYDHYRDALAFRPDYAEAMSNALLAAQYDSRYSAAGLLAEHRRFAERFERPLRHRWSKHDRPRDASRRLRIGFVSGDLRNHPVGFFLESVLANIDRCQFDITLYPTTSARDELSQRLMDSDISWQPLTGLSDDAAAQRIAATGIDILVDLSGHTADNRLLLFARKPAPVQVSWLYFSTTGLTAIDYLLCDRHVVPADEVAYFVERPWYLPDAYLCFTPPRENIPEGRLPVAAGGATTFGCFNNLTKLSEEVVALWARILRCIPDARLILKAKQLNDPTIRETTRQRFLRHNVAADRLVLEPPSSRADYFAAYRRIDIALDPFPFPGGTTTVEALWMGVPVLTRRGDRFISHAGESILATAGLPDWIAADDGDYLTKAIAFAADQPRLAELRSSLRAQVLASPLCDAPRFARNLETAFRAMWTGEAATS